MTTLIWFLSGWGLLVSLLGCIAGCVMRVKRNSPRSCEAGAGFVERWRGRLVPLELLQGRWPVRVLCNDGIFWLAVMAAIVVLFVPGHTEIIANGLGLNWPGMAFRWADGLSVVVTLAVLALPLRRLLLADLRGKTSSAEWRIMALLVCVPFFGLLARSGMPGYVFWLVLHLVTGHVFLWCAPHHLNARLLR